MSDTNEKKGAVNFNTIVSFVILGVLAWAGSTLQSNRADVAKLNGKIDVLEVKLTSAEKMSTEHNQVAVEQLLSVKNDLQSLRSEVASQRIMIGQLQVDLARVAQKP